MGWWHLPGAIARDLRRDLSQRQPWTAMPRIGKLVLQPDVGEIERMAKKKKPPSWQEGRDEFEITLPADVTKSGKEETVTLAYSWETSATRPMTAREKIAWEIEGARNSLEQVASALNSSQGFNADLVAHDLVSAFDDAIWAWCGAHLRGEGTNTESAHRAFLEKAPENLKRTTMEGRLALNGLAQGAISAAEALPFVRASVEAILEAASHPPRNRRRFPAHLRANKPTGKPRVKPGGWIDTGRYRPAQVLEMMSEPPNIMKLSYGDEIDEDFRPHIVEWETIRKPKRLPSLKDVFSPGDWMRHERFGYAQVLGVRNSTMDVDYGNGKQTFAPDQHLSKIEKVAEPEPRDTRPACERFPPGTWIKQDHIGEGVVLNVEDDVLTVLLSKGNWVEHIHVCSDGSNAGEGPVVWTLDRPPLDMTLPRVQREIWWRQEKELPWRCSGSEPCPCCGYLNLGIGEEYDLEPRQCVICGWFDDSADEEDAEEVRPAADWEDPYGDAEYNCGYSLAEARKNFEASGIMFRPDDRRREPLEKLGDLRRSLVALFDRAMADPAGWNNEAQATVDEIVHDIRAALGMLR